MAVVGGLIFQSNNSFDLKYGCKNAPSSVTLRYVTLAIGLSGMRLKYNHDQRREYLVLTDHVGMEWMNMFQGDKDFYSAAYWDLLTGLWRVAQPMRKTDALNLMQGIKSAHTAGKYLETALARGIVVERDNPNDARSKLVELSADMRHKLDGFFDAAVSRLRATSRRVDVLGPSPEEP